MPLRDSPRVGVGIARLVGMSAVSQILVLGLSGGLVVITTRLIIGNFGVEAYAQYGLLVSIAGLVPFADMGMSAAVINAVGSSTSPRHDDMVRRTILTTFRVLLVAAGIFACLSVLLAWTGAWPTLLGNGLLPGGGPAASICVLLFAATLPLGVGQRILTGLGKNHLRIGIQAVSAPFILIIVLILVTVGYRSGNYLAVLYYLAAMVTAAASLGLAARLVRPQVTRALHDVHRIKSVPGINVMRVAWPMLVQMLAVPIAMQTDRLLLSHLAPKDDLARYILASQLFGLLLQTIGAAGIALWPIFARARTDEDVRSPFPLMWAFLAGGLLLAGILASLLPWVTPIVSAGRIHLDSWLVLGFIAFVAAEAAVYPLGMYMTDLRGLRFQVIPVLVMVPSNLALSWTLVAPLGAAGPIIGSAVTVAVFQGFPYAWYVRTDLRARRSPVGDATSGE